jgi:hypothetical protein
VQLVDEVLASPYITVKGAEAALKVTFPTAQNAITRLVDAGILEEITGQRRNRVYRAGEILALLDDAPGGALPGPDSPGDEAGGTPPGA